MAPKRASAAQVLDVHERDAVPDLGGLQQAFEALRDGEFVNHIAFTKACFMLRVLFHKIAADPENPKLRRLPRSHRQVATDLLIVPGFEDAMLDLRWKADECTLTFDRDASELQTAAAQIHEVEAWVLRRETQLVMPVRDAEGWSNELHHPGVLVQDDKFKGAVWHISHRSSRPDGVVVFHNSPFSNYATCGAGIQVVHDGQNFSFSTSEAIIMAFQEHMLIDTPLPDALLAMAETRTGSEAKQLTKRHTRNVIDKSVWHHHGLHVLVGASACLPKFAQDEGMRRLLLNTQQALLIETAPHDGSWGVGEHAGNFLCRSEPAHFALASTLASTGDASLRYETRDGKVVDRRLCEANALGKALMIVRDILRALDEVGEEVPVELGRIVQRVGIQLRNRGVPFAWQGLHTSLDRLLSED